MILGMKLGQHNKKLNDDVVGVLISQVGCYYITNATLYKWYLLIVTCLLLSMMCLCFNL